MGMYIAHNAALSTTTSVGAGTSLAAGSKVTLQLQIPDNGHIELVEFGWSQDVATATASLVELASTDSGSTLTTGHTTTTIKQIDEGLSAATASRLTMGTTGTSYGSASITTNTTLRSFKHLYVPQVYVYQWPLGDRPKVGTSTTESFLQLRCNTTATVNVLAWVIWREHI